MFRKIVLSSLIGAALAVDVAAPLIREALVDAGYQ